MSNRKHTRATPFLVLLACALNSPDIAFGQSATVEFPYRAQVLKEQATVYSGPGAMHYGTDKLSRDSIVEVYRHDPGGWLAIRPPDGSFSLVMSSDVMIGDDNLAIVTNPGRAWVGTKLSKTDKPMWQVQLKNGEVLEVLGSVDRRKYQLGENEPDWIQVAPPSGEFRWIHEDDVEPISPPKLAETDRTASPALADYQAQSNTVIVQQSFDDWTFDDAASQQEHQNHGWRPARRSIATLIGTRSEYIADVPSETAFAETTSTPVAAARLMGQIAQGDHSAAINQLDLALTQEMLRSPIQWNLDPIERQVRMLQPGLATLDRAKADRLLEKIRRCREIQAGENAAASGPSIEVAATVPASPANPTWMNSQPVGGGVSQTTDSRDLANPYDAVGWLNEFVQDGGQGPPSYVLQDETGKIISFVTPAPGVNLHRYLRKQIGVVGNRGFHRRFNLDHVTAERVIAIDTVRR